jgi:site-specific recombinase XerD
MLANYMKPFFSHYLPVQKGLAANTMLAYRDAIKLLLCYAADTLHKSVDELSVEDINAVSPHTVRHTTAMHLLRAGNDVTMVSTSRIPAASMAFIAEQSVKLYCLSRRSV